jgi:hypothetical protein
LKNLLKELSDSSAGFQKEVRATLESMKVRREEAARGTQHGKEFELLVGDVLGREARQGGDVLEPTGNTVGKIPRSKVGDHIITLGPESQAAGARIVVECKEKAGYSETEAIREMDEARHNRDAQVGIFVFSKETAPAGVPPFRRVGCNVLCVWDKNDAQSDVFLQAALSVARALAIRERLSAERARADLSEIEEAVSRIERDARNLGEVLTCAGNIARDSRRILESLTPIQGSIEAQLRRLRDAIADLKTSETGG